MRIAYMKKLYNQLFEPIKNVCRKSAGRNVIMMAAVLFSSYQGWGQTAVVSLSGPTCTTGTLTLTSSIQPDQIVWQLNGVTQSTVNSSWNAAGTTVAGNGVGTGVSNINGPDALFRDASGNLYIADFLNNRVIEFPSTSTAGSNGVIVAGSATNVAGTTAALLNGPTGVWVDGSGVIYVSDAGNNRIQKFPATSTAGTSGTTVAGQGSTSLSQLNNPQGIVGDASGNLFVADQGNNRIMKFANISTSTAGTAGVIAAGSATSTAGPGTTQLNAPTGVFISNTGNLYVADFGNNRVQNFGTATSSTSSTAATTVAGGNGNGSAANQLNNPTNVSVDGLNNVYVADAYNNRIQEWLAGATTGITVAGSAAGTAGNTAGLLNLPWTVTLHAAGVMWVSDYSNRRIQSFTPTIPLTFTTTAPGNYTAIVTTFAGIASTTAPYAVTVPPTVTTNPTAQTICANAGTSFTGAGSATNTTLTYRWQVSTNSGTSYTNITDGPTGTGAVYSNTGTATLNIATADVSLNGYLYRLTITGGCTPAVNTTGALLTVNPATTTTNPTAATICAIGGTNTGNTSFTVTAGGQGPYTYVWQAATSLGGPYTTLSDAGPFTGSATATLTITGATTTINNTYYRAVVSGGCGTATSTGAQLTVNALPTITTQPSAVTACAGGNVTFNVASSGGATYQWQVSTNNGTSYTNLVNGVPTNGVTTQTLDLSGVTTSMNNNLYRLQVTTTAGCFIYSNAVALTVNATPSIATQPTAQAACAGSTATFSVTAGTFPGVTYQWQQSIDGGTTFQPISGATSATYTTPVTTFTTPAYQYNVIVSSTTCAAPVTSNNVTLTVNTPASIATAPQASTVCVGQSTSFSVTAATGSGTLTYQWKVSVAGGAFNNVGTGTTGGTTATLSIASPTFAMNGNQYEVVITGTCAPLTATSTPVTLTVNQPPTTTNPVNATACSGTSPQFTVTGGGTSPTYQWQVSTNGGSTFAPILATNTAYTGQLTGQLTIVSATTAMNGFVYNVIVSGVCTPSSVTSANATLNVNLAPSLTLGAQPSVCQGATSASLSYTGFAGSFGTVTTNFAVTGATQTFTVPTGVTSINFDIAGARGGNNYGGNGAGLGGRLQANYTVSPGQIYNIFVGGVGVNGANATAVPVSAGGFNGGGNGSVSATGLFAGAGGGGATDIRFGGTALTNRILVAAGGGGAATEGTTAAGGNGGGISGSAGGVTALSTSTAAGGGTLSAGGAGSTNTTLGYIAGGTGTISNGGNAGQGESGGGGGGFYGGGGGTQGDAAGGGGGGGGGASYGNGFNTLTNTTGYNNAAGYAALTYTIPTTYTIVYSAAAITAGFVNVPTTNVPTGTTGSFPITIPAAAPVAVYTATVNVFNGTCTTSYPITITVSGAPVVTTQPPINNTMCVGSTITIRDTASGNVPAYTWQVSTNGGTTYTNLANGTTGGVTYSGVLTNVLTIANATAALNNNLYRTSITSACGGAAVVSNPDTLHVTSPATITTQPIAQAYACAGSNYTLSVVATATGNQYQWYQNTGSGFAIITGATASTYTISGITAAMNGYTYNVVVTGICGSPVPSSTTTLNVSSTTAPTPTPQPLSADSLCPGANLILTLTTGTNPATNYFVISGPSGYTATTNAASVFVNAATTATAGAYVIYDSIAQNGCRSASVTDNIYVPASPTVSVGATSPAVCYGQSLNLYSSVTSAITIDSTMFTTPLNSDTLVPSRRNILPAGSFSSSFGPSIPVTQFIDAGTYQFAVYTHVAGNVCIFTAPSFNVTINALPATPTVLPGNKQDSVCASSPISLIASSTTGGVSYKWTGPNGPTDIQTTSTYSKASATAANQGLYNVVAINSTTNCASIPDTLFLKVKPVPANPGASSNTPVCIGQPLNLKATSATADSFYWTGPGTPAFSATVQNPTVVSATLSNAGTYTVTAYLSGCASLANKTTVVQINSIPQDPTITSNSPICAGQTLIVTATDSTTPVTYHQVEINLFNPLPNGLHSADSSVLVVPNAQVSDTGKVCVTVKGSNGCPAANTACIPVTILPLPIRPTLSAVSPICEGTTLTINFSDGTGAPGTIPPGQPLYAGPGVTFGASGNSTSNPFLIGGATPAASGLYTAYATLNGCRSLQADSINIVVSPAPAVPVATSNSPVCSGTTIKLFANAATAGPGPDPLTYKWSGTGGGFSSTTTRNTTIPNATTANNGFDSVYAINSFGCKSVLPGITAVVVNSSPSLPPQVSNLILCQFSPVGPLTAIGTNLHWYTSATDLVGTTVAPTPNDSIPGVYTYYVTQASGIGCESSRAAIVVTVNQKPAPPAVTSTSVTYCQYDATMVLAATGQNLLWYTTSAGGVGTPLAPVPSTNAPANYVYYVSQSVNGCESNRQPITVIVKQKPQPPIVQDISYCQYDVAAPLTAVGGGLRWYNVANGGVGTPIPPVPLTSYPDTITYYVTQTVNGCESDRVPQHVYIFYKPNVVIKSTRAFVCQNDTMTFFYFGNALPSASFDWGLPAGASIVSSYSPDVITVLFTQAGNQDITLTVGNGNCKSPSTSVIVQVRAQPTAGISSLHDVCQDDIVVVGLTDQSLNTQSYNFNFDGGTIISTASQGGPFNIQWTTGGTHIVSLITTLAECASKPVYDTVNVHPKPTAKILTVGALDLNNICSGDSVALTAGLVNPLYQYVWSPTQFFRNGNSQAAVFANIDFSSTIVLTVTSDFGCVGVDSGHITIAPCCNLYLPNAFTPNGDGKNDFFHILTIGHHTIRDFRVVNRWGQTVFQTTDELGHWDGTYNGVPQDMDTYFWFVDYVCEPGGKEIKEQGEVYLVR